MSFKIRAKEFLAATWIVAVFTLLAAANAPMAVAAQPGADTPPAVEKVNPREKCPVCGMFVARYPNWISQLHLDGGETLHFDGMKDLLAYYFNPESFGGKKEAEVKAVWAKDYYTLQWVEARQAHFVVGSNVHGPMGHEFIPLDSRQAAENFMKEHQGREILTFDEITPEKVRMMRTGHQMKMKMKMGH